MKNKIQNSRQLYAGREAGLTLVEILIVLVIIGLVGGWLASRTFGAGDKAKSLMTKTQTKQIGQYIEQFQLQYNALPQTLLDLACEGGNVQNCSPVARAEELKDAWGNDFVYSVEDGGRRYRIKSFGADGKEGGDKYDADLFGTGP